MTDLASEEWVTKFNWLESAELEGEMRHTGRTMPPDVENPAHASKQRLRRHLASSSSQHMVRYLSPKFRGSFSSGTCLSRFSEYRRAFASTSPPPRQGDFATNIRD